MPLNDQIKSAQNELVSGFDLNNKRSLVLDHPYSKWMRYVYVCIASVFRHLMFAIFFPHVHLFLGQPSPNLTVDSRYTDRDNSWVSGQRPEGSQPVDCNLGDEHCPKKATPGLPFVGFGPQLVGCFAAPVFPYWQSMLLQNKTSRHHLGNIPQIKHFS